MSPTARTVGCLGALLALVIVAGTGAIWLLSNRGPTAPAPAQQRCVATANDRTVVIDLEQAHFASIVVGISVQRGLPARAASIAMATVYQESGIRNLNYGDRDSLGLFQQRPSQGWGTKKQVSDPYYSTGKFYDALVKVKNWRTGDINDVAQKVQISGFPEAYRDHVEDGRVLASVFTGNSPGGFSCLDRTDASGDSDGLMTTMSKTFGDIDSTITTAEESTVLRVQSSLGQKAWAYAHFAVANASYFGVTTVKIGDQVWQTQDLEVPEWTTSAPALGARQVEITLRG